MNLRHLLTTAVLLTTALWSPAPASAAIIYQYVGEWHVGEGPLWSSNPDVLNAVETAALLFGGSPDDYAISTVDSDPANINFMAHVDGWGDSQYLTTPVSQTFKLDTGAPGYNPYPSYSAYVLDHSCSYRYSNPTQECAETEPGRNFAFRIQQTAEPATVALLGTALATALRRRRRSVP